jgi:3'-phosphoadenosine 5'-phosphosulfate sulfotransferase (PAPS reductase)/FAD synthetase
MHNLFGEFIPQTVEEILQHAPLAPCRPTAVLIAFSGGNDSRVMAHRCKSWLLDAGYLPRLAAIRTGLQMDGWEQSVRDYAEWLGLPVEFYEGEGRVYYTRYVEQYGFPGSAVHGQIQNRLKGRAYRKMVLAHRTATEKQMSVDGAAVWILSGIRKDESRKRQLLTSPYSAREGAQFINPLFYWSNAQVADYLNAHDIPHAPGKQWDCKCGATVKSRPAELADMERNGAGVCNYLQSLHNPKSWQWGEFDATRHSMDEQVAAGQMWLDDGSLENYPTCINCVRDALADDERAMREW